ncbi:MAG: GWxTD domain-containing protein [Taibaiella sp.]|nr:GWxTD domain-containing protein [Taibaiella sp.]
MLRWWLICFFAVAMPFYAGALEAIVSHTIFYLPHMDKGHTANPYIEAAWQIDPRSVQFRKTAQDTWGATLRTDILFKNEAGLIVREDHYLLKPTPQANLVKAAGQVLMDLRRYTLQPGFTTMQLKLTDLNDSLRPYLYTDTFTINPSAGSVYYSGLQLLDTIYNNNATGVFQKNNRQQIPMTTDFFDTNRNVLHYYTELYNADLIPKDDQPVAQVVFISKRAGESPVLNLAQKDTVLYQPVQPVSGTLNIYGLPSGNYYLNVTMANKDKVTIGTQSLPFQRLNNRKLETNELYSGNFDTAFQRLDVFNADKTFVGKFTTQQLKAILIMLRPVATPAEEQAIRAFAKSPDNDYMRYFIYNHFAEIDKKAPEKEWQKFADRVREVNKLYGNTSTAGYATDKGYIYMKYGKPDEDIAVQSERGAVPYELWQYNNINHKYNNVVFLFYQPDNLMNSYRLLHATIPVEARNPNWRTLININGSNQSEPNSTAEQYIGNR